jgi:hypothetical protein
MDEQKLHSTPNFFGGFKSFCKPINPYLKYENYNLSFKGILTGNIYKFHHKRLYMGIWSHAIQKHPAWDSYKKFFFGMEGDEFAKAFRDFMTWIFPESATDSQHLLNICRAGKVSTFGPPISLKIDEVADVTKALRLSLFCKIMGTAIALKYRLDPKGIASDIAETIRDSTWLHSGDLLEAEGEDKKKLFHLTKIFLERISFHFNVIFSEIEEDKVFNAVCELSTFIKNLIKDDEAAVDFIDAISGGNVLEWMRSSEVAKKIGGLRLALSSLITNEESDRCECTIELCREGVKVRMLTNLPVVGRKFVEVGARFDEIQQFSIEVQGIEPSEKGFIIKGRLLEK